MQYFGICSGHIVEPSVSSLKRVFVPAKPLYIFSSENPFNAAKALLIAYIGSYLITLTRMQMVDSQKGSLEGINGLHNYFLLGVAERVIEIQVAFNGNIDFHEAQCEFVCRVDHRFRVFLS